MEVPQGNSLCSYFKHPKMSFFSLFFLIQNQTQQGNTGAAWKEVGIGSWYQWEGGEDREMVKEGEYGANTYTLICKWKNDIC
jgi:hypothetical protein